MNPWFMLSASFQVLFAFVAAAELSVAPVFTDNMVLQRDQPLPIWGKADAGDKILIGFANQTRRATADSNGNWKVVLTPLPACAEPAVLSIVESRQRELSVIGSRQFTNVLVGEVWLAAGQSNMEFPLSREAHAAHEIPAATNSLIRLLNLPFAGQFCYTKPFASNEVAHLTPEQFFHGAWQACSPTNAKDFSAIAYYFGREIQQDLHVPVGLLDCAVGGSPTEAWISRSALAGDPELQAMTRGDWLTNSVLDDWCRKRGHENLEAGLAAGLTVPGDDLGPNHHFKPAFLWDAGPARFAPFAIRGVLWYQGESNSLEERRVRQHEKLFPLLVRNWRAAWGVDFPFLFCQLSSIRTNHYQSACWPEFRDQQRRVLDRLPNTGMAVTSDLGALDDVHPRNKREVAHRLALWALVKTYGEQSEFSGPQPQGLHRDGNKLIIQFSHAKELKAGDGGRLRGFEIAGTDGAFQVADTRITENRITLSANEVVSPAAVRYGWEPYSDGNLVNGDGLPASTFELSATP